MVFPVVTISTGNTIFYGGKVMENSKRSGGSKLDKFFAGKGFYIVLFLCAAVIGVSVWTLMSGEKTVEADQGADITLEQPANVQEPPVDAQQGESNEAMWEIPEGVEEVPVEAPDVSSVTVSEPEPQEPAQTVDTARAFVWPVVGEIELPYAVSYLVYSDTMGDWRAHKGLDIAAALGDRVLAAAAGTVSAVYDDPLFGTTVVIEHGDGLVSSYANLAATPTVAVGDKVLCGDTIGSVGDTACCESAMTTHLHFAMSLEGESVDPTVYLPAI